MGSHAASKPSRKEAREAAKAAEQAKRANFKGAKSGKVAVKAVTQPAEQAAQTEQAEKPFRKKAATGLIRLTGLATGAWVGLAVSKPLLAGPNVMEDPGARAELVSHAQTVGILGAIAIAATAFVARKTQGWREPNALPRPWPFRKHKTEAPAQAAPEAPAAEPNEAGVQSTETNVEADPQAPRSLSKEETDALIANLPGHVSPVETHAQQPQGPVVPENFHLPS